MKLCECGCGEQTKISQRTHTRYGHVKGQPLRYLFGHNARKQTGPGPNPEGICLCGCGEKVPIAKVSRSERGDIAGRPVRYLPGHAKRGTSYHYWGGKIEHEGYLLVHAPTHPKADENGRVREHVLIAEKALGRFLPDEAIVHHVDGVGTNNRNDNLVICPSTSYHQIIRMRQKALRACGDPSWRSCNFCKQWDSPDKLRSFRSNYFHPACKNQDNRSRSLAKKKALAALAACLFLFTGGCSARPPHAPPPPSPPMVEAQAVEAPEPQRVEPPVEISYLDSLEPDVSEAAKKFIATGKAEAIDRRKTTGFAVVPYDAMAVPTVTCKAGQFCRIKLEKGEFIKSKHGWYIADETRWMAFPMEYGEGEDLVQSILLKPLDTLPYLKTNIQFGTNRRAYNIDVVSGSKTTRSLEFWYPQDIVKELNQSAEQRRAKEKTIAARGLQVDLKNLSTRYNIECNGARFCPSFVGSDNARTFILLPQGLEALGVPTVMIQRSGENQIPNINFQGLPWVTIEGLIDRAQIRYGMDSSQPVVEIMRY